MSIEKLPRFNNIYLHHRFIKELNKELKGFSYRKDFEEWFMSSLRILDDPEIDSYADSFGGKGDNRFKQIDTKLYRIAYHKSEKNIRIIYTVLKGRVIILLGSFDEKILKVITEITKSLLEKGCKTKEVL